MYILKKKMVNIVDNMPRKMSTFNSARVKLAAQGKKRIIAFIVTVLVILCHWSLCLVKCLFFVLYLVLQCF